MKTDWKLFSELLNEKIDLKISMKNIEELELAPTNFIETIRGATKESIRGSNSLPPREVQHSLEVRKLLKMRRRPTKIWQNSRYLPDKTRFNRISQKLTRMINVDRQQSIQKYLESLIPGIEKDYSF